MKTGIPLRSAKDGGIAWKEIAVAAFISAVAVAKIGKILDRIFSK